MSGPEPYYQDDLITLHLGKCEEVLTGFADSSIDAIVTDPPYGLEFMGAEWDTFKTGDGFRRSRNPADIGRDNVFGRISRTGPEYATGAGKQPKIGDADGTPFRRNAGTPSWAASGNPRCANCGGTKYDRTRPNGCSCDSPAFPVESASHNNAFQAWCQQWATECLRVLKPGGWMLAFGGTRTWHRLTCGIEDAGFEIRDGTADLIGQDAPGLMWVYGSGFAKSRDAARAVDMEVCALPGRHCMRKLPDNPNPDDHVCPESEEGKEWSGWGTAAKPAWEPIVVARKPLAGTLGRNLLEHGTGAINVDGCRIAAGQDYRDKCASVVGLGSNRNGDAYGEWTGERTDSAHDAGRWVPNVLITHSADCADECAPGCPAAELDRQSGYSSEKSRILNRNGTRKMDGWGLAAQSQGIVHGDSGGASRYFPAFRYSAKAPTSERPRLPDGTAWPTVKPLDLVRYLVRLVTPPDGKVLDLFAGTGPTGEACIIEGFPCILIEKDPVAAELIKTRLSKPIQPVLFGEAAS